MTEKELIKKIKKLQQIKPSENWVILTKEKILSEQKAEYKQGKGWISQFISVFNVSPYLKPAFATVVCFCFLIGVFSFAQNALPGDMLYSVKKLSEQAKISLASDQEKPKVQLELTQKKLNELTKIAEENKGKNLASAVQEVESAMKDTAKSLKNTVVTPEVREKVQVIETQKEKVEEILATRIDSQGLKESMNDYDKNLAKQQIEYLEERTLNPEQQELFKEAKEFFDNGDYQEALAKILILSY